jgi:hypothetical protein
LEIFRQARNRVKGGVLCRRSDGLNPSLIALKSMGPR